MEPLGHKTGLNTEEQHVSTLGRIRDRAEYDTKNWCFDTLDFQYILIRFINDMYFGFINKESIYKIKWKYMTKGCINDHCPQIEVCSILSFSLSHRWSFSSDSNYLTRSKPNLIDIMQMTDQVVVYINFVVWFLLAGGDKKTESGAGADPSFQFVSICNPGLGRITLPLRHGFWH